MGEPAAARIVEAVLMAEMVSRTCQLRPYEHGPAVKPFELSGDVIAYASPDSTFAVTRELLEAARKSILVGIYDFTATYVADLLLAAAARGVDVTVMVDLDHRKGEPGVWEALASGGCRTVPAPSCASRASRYFPSCHEKVIVVDGEWSLVQSGNWSESSIPRNEADGVRGRSTRFRPGNRDMGVAVRSRRLASHLAGILRRDIELELAGDTPEAAEGTRVAAPPLQAAAPAGPPKLFPSLRLNPSRPIRTTAVVSPEDYMETMVPVLSRARTSIRVEQQYIRSRQPEVRRLLEAIRSAVEKSPGLDVRVVIAPPFPGDVRAREDVEALDEFGLRLGTHVRLLNPRQFVHCHNKLVAVDGKVVLISSQNWSDFALTRNREAGLLLRSAELAGYYGKIFDADWKSGITFDQLDDTLGDLESVAAETVPIRLGDFIEV